MDLPFAFYAIIFGCIVVMGISAFHLRDESKTVAGFARVGLVVGGAGLFVSTMFYASILVAALIVMLPVALVVAWWNGAF